MCIAVTVLPALTSARPGGGLCSLVAQSLVPRSLAPQSAQTAARFGSRSVLPALTSARPGGGLCCPG